MRASAGPPQIISAHFQPRERATSCWLRHEIRKVLLLVPFIRATGGCGSKPFTCCELAVFPGELLPFPLDVGFAGSGMTSTPPGLVILADGTPAAAQAVGLASPAFSRAAEIFCCCDISTDLVGADSGDRRITSWRASDGIVKTWTEGSASK